MTRLFGLVLAATLLVGCGCPVLAGDSAAGRGSQSAEGFISVAELVRLQRSGQRVQLADLRPQADHDRFHLEGAARLTPLQLRTLDAWKESTVVLVGTGMAYQALIALRAQLMADGFADARILDGGTRQWSQAVRKGRPATAVSSPRQLDLEGDAERWTVITAEAGNGLHGVSVPVLVADLNEPREVLKALPELTKRHGPDSVSHPVRNLLIASANPQQGMALLNRIESSLVANVFVLNGSLADIEAEIEGRRALALNGSTGRTVQVGGQCW